MLLAIFKKNFMDVFVSVNLIFNSYDSLILDDMIYLDNCGICGRDYV